ncbi:hypothetical protein TeGR_g9663 [Tetraparma gracilis]|uniref:Metallo-beta-lactamase domain-containing protein n=1 Tax=Tetraparma gracilis TaxID=2962635 RepID=A0ABQ6N169_9STRA|nr:hypothetical protein TeGR_g9663 [Tetraparma gracilis]
MVLFPTGTASCVPSATRGTSSLAFRSPLGTWLFDAGEGTQLQLQSAPVTKSKINRIFVTHAHGDHTFGLPGLLCFLGVDRARDPNQPIEIYGPEGLRSYLRSAVRYTSSRICPCYRVHELRDVPLAPGWRPWKTRGKVGG